MLDAQFGNDNICNTRFRNLPPGGYGYNKHFIATPFIFCLMVFQTNNTTVPRSSKKRGVNIHSVLTPWANICRKVWHKNFTATPFVFYIMVFSRNNAIVGLNNIYL